MAIIATGIQNMSFVLNECIGVDIISYKRNKMGIGKKRNELSDEM